MTRELKNIRSVFKRMETDDEYRDRLIKEGVPNWVMYGEQGAGLDGVGDRYKLQRKIVEDVA